MSIEYELKYAATAEALEAIENALGGGFVSISMETTYFDTPEGDLSARRWTLRRRMENGVPVCTLKTPAGDLGRGEWECQCGRIEEAVPELCKLSGQTDLALLLDRGLTPICGARFQRQAKAVETGGTVVEVALDSGVLMGGGTEAPLCEVEVELKSGSREEAVLYAALLARQFDLRPEPKSKFIRALELAQRNR